MIVDAFIIYGIISIALTRWLTRKNQSRMEGKDFVLYATAPLIGILECPRIAKIIQKNNIDSFSDFIRPFGERIGKIETQDALGNNVQIDPCYLRFGDINKLDPIDWSKMQSILTNVLADYDDSFKLPILKSKNEVEEYREEAVFEHMTPWFHQYRAIVTKYLGSSEHETINHPVTCI